LPHGSHTGAKTTGRPFTKGKSSDIAVQLAIGVSRASAQRKARPPAIVTANIRSLYAVTGTLRRAVLLHHTSIPQL
jgi:hypothetical protein